jgi:hypothetical protein
VLRKGHADYLIEIQPKISQLNSDVNQFLKVSGSINFVISDEVNLIFEM